MRNNVCHEMHACTVQSLVNSYSRIRLQFQNTWHSHLRTSCHSCHMCSLFSYRFLTCYRVVVIDFWSSLVNFQSYKTNHIKQCVSNVCCGITNVSRSNFPQSIFVYCLCKYVSQYSSSSLVREIKLSAQSTSKIAFSIILLNNRPRLWTITHDLIPNLVHCCCSFACLQLRILMLLALRSSLVDDQFMRCVKHDQSSGRLIECSIDSWVNIGLVVCLIVWSTNDRLFDVFWHLMECLDRSLVCRVINAQNNCLCIDSSHSLSCCLIFTSTLKLPSTRWL